MRNSQFKNARKNYKARRTAKGATIRNDRDSQEEVAINYGFVKKILLGCVTLILLVGSFYGVRSFLYLPISAVKIIGAREYVSDEKLQSEFMPYVSAGFFGLKISNLQQQLVSLPWVKWVGIQRVWPKSVIIKIKEHQPKALWRLTDNNWKQFGVISQEGELFFPEELIGNDALLNLNRQETDKYKKLSALPILVGPKEQHIELLNKYDVFSKELTKIGLSIERLELANRGAWQIKLASDLTIVLGTTDVDLRLARFINAFKKNLISQQNKIAYVDLRYTSGMAIGWKAG